MRKKLLIVLLGLLAHMAPGQSRLSVSALTAPTLIRTSYNRTYLFPDSDGQVVEPIFIGGTRQTIGVVTGLEAQYWYAPGWSLSAGLGYSQSFMRQSRLPAAGEGTTSIRSRALRVPLLLNYQPLTKRLSPYFTLGMLLDFPLASRVIVDRSGLPTQRLRLGTEPGPVFHPMVGAGGRYAFHERWTLVVQPSWAYNLGRFGGAQTYTASHELSIRVQLTYALQ
jgi:hypothetical protein